MELIVPAQRRRVLVGLGWQIIANGQRGGLRGGQGWRMIVRQAEVRRRPREPGELHQRNALRLRLQFQRRLRIGTVREGVAEGFIGDRRVREYRFVPRGGLPPVAEQEADAVAARVVGE